MVIRAYWVRKLRIPATGEIRRSRSSPSRGTAPSVQIIGEEVEMLVRAKNHVANASVASHEEIVLLLDVLKFGFPEVHPDDALASEGGEEQPSLPGVRHDVAVVEGVRRRAPRSRLPLWRTGGMKPSPVSSPPTSGQP